MALVQPNHPLIKGTLNNLTYVIIISFSKDLCIQFGEENLIGLLSGCMNIFGTIIPFLYGKFALKWKHRHKLSGVIGFWLLGILLIFIAKKLYLFTLVLFGCILLGFATTIGGLVILGFIKCFPPIVFTGFSSGTGAAGLFGSLFYLILKVCNTPFNYVLLFTISWYPLYYCFFVSLLKSRFEIGVNKKIGVLIDDDDDCKNNYEEKESINTRSRSDSNASTNSNFPLVQNDSKLVEDLSDFEVQEAEINDFITFENTKKLIMKMKNLYFLFCIMYFLEYISITELADQISSLLPSSILEGQRRDLFFSMAMFLYQLGVFFGRSSLDYLQVKRPIYVILAIAVLVGSLFVQIYLKVFLSVFSLYCLYILIGVFGGIGYCNICFLLMSDDSISKRTKVIVILRKSRSF